MPVKPVFWAVEQKSSRARSENITEDKACLGFHDRGSTAAIARIRPGMDIPVLAANCRRDIGMPIIRPGKPPDIPHILRKMPHIRGQRSIRLLAAVRLYYGLVLIDKATADEAEDVVFRVRFDI